MTFLRFTILTAAILCSFCLSAQITTNSQWTWMGGDSTSNIAGIYGTLGVPSATNKPGPREGCGMNWTDSAGNLWLFGDYGYDVNGISGYLNDLWEYGITTNMWTWVNGSNTVNAAAVYGVKGVAAATNNPGARHLSTTWIDNSGDLWLFGGYGYSSSLNDLWKYNIASNQWTWMSGDNTSSSYGVYGTQGVEAPTNKPGSRSRACRPDGKADAFGNLWLFGGYGLATSTSGELNDLWKYNTGTNQWTWMSGDVTPVAPSVYGTMGVPDPANKPGARVGGICWIDKANKFWLSGGSYQASYWSPKFSDLWEYDPLTNMWTWMKGDNTNNNYGVYGTLGVAAATNNPGGRLMAMCWIDTTGNFWVFGGYGYSSPTTANSTGTQGLNDLWKYDPLTNNWTWVKGDSIPNAAGYYGTLGLPSALNKPGDRSGTDQWFSNGNLWLFGGLDWAGTSGAGFKLDLWKLGKDSFSWIGVTSIDWTDASNWSGSVVPGPTDVVTIPAATPYSPSVLAGTIAYCKDITVLPGAVLTVQLKSSLTVSH